MLKLNYVNLSSQGPRVEGFRVKWLINKFRGASCFSELPLEATKWL